jgi:hypothetical protein
MDKTTSTHLHGTSANETGAGLCLGGAGYALLTPFRPQLSGPSTQPRLVPEFFSSSEGGWASRVGCPEYLVWDDLGSLRPVLQPC